MAESTGLKPAIFPWTVGCFIIKLRLLKMVISENRGARDKAWPSNRGIRTASLADKWSGWWELNPLPPSSELGRLPLTIHPSKWSERKDLNLRPLDPKSSALTRLRYTPFKLFLFLNLLELLFSLSLETQTGRFWENPGSGKNIVEPLSVFLAVFVSAHTATRTNVFRG